MPNNLNLIKIKDVTYMVCPFRTRTVSRQVEDSGSVIQEVSFPECHYLHCPFYNAIAADNSERCFRANEI